MPLYADSNFYYSGGSSQLFSPYYPGSSSLSSGSSSLYSPYTSTFNRAISGSYAIPVSSSRTPSYSLASSSRYQPKLSTITESSPLMSVSRHSSLMPLTRINSPKYTSYSSTPPVHIPKYVPPKPILINTADIDVSANRYRQRKAEALRQVQLEHEAEMAARNRKEPETDVVGRNEKNKVETQVAQKYAKTTNENVDEEPPRRNRSTIKRNRAVVRLSTIRSRSKERNRIKVEDLYGPEPEKKKYKDRLDKVQAQATEITPTEPNDTLLNKENLQEVLVELDPNNHTERRLSIPQCPTFHDICEDISSDKIDDDLNAGELRRRRSIIQEEELLNQLQNSPSGTFQVINLERRESHDSTDSQSNKRLSKRQSKKGNRIRHKITAIVEVDNAPSGSEDSSFVDAEKSPLPKFSANVDSIEEHHEIHKVFKLPKKKNVKKVTKAKDQPLPEGFMSAIAKPQQSPKKKMLEKKETYKTTAEIFTFDEKALEEITNVVEKEQTFSPVDFTESAQGKEVKSPGTPKSAKEDPKATADMSTPKPSTPKSVADQKPTTPIKKSSTSSFQLKSPTTPLKADSAIKAKDEPKSCVEPKTITTDTPKDIEGAMKSPTKAISSSIFDTESLKSPIKKLSSPPLNVANKLNKEASMDTADTLKKNESLKSPTKTTASPSIDVVDKPTANKPYGKNSSTNVELKSQTSATKLVQSPTKECNKEEMSVATPKPIRKGLKKSESGEDFWAQIGPRESLYMNKRKQEVIERQWKKRENLLESTTNEEVSNLDDIMASVKQQKEEALKSAIDEEISSQSSNIGRSSSNESTFKKETGTLKIQNEEEKKTLSKLASKEEEIKPLKVDEKNSKAVQAKEGDNQLGKVEGKQVPLTKFKSDDKVEKKSSPIKKMITSPKSTQVADKSSNKPCETESKEAKFSNKLENSKAKISTPVTQAIVKTTSATTITTTTTTPTKITGHVAKSPEQQEQEEQKTKQTTQAKSNSNNKNELDINKTSAIATKTNDQPPALLAKPPTAATEDNQNNSNVKVTAGTAKAAATKQPETKATSTAMTAAEAKPLAAAATAENALKSGKKLPVDAKKMSSPTKAKSQTPPKSKAKVSPQSVINADQFVAKAPAKANVSPVKQSNLAISKASSSSSPSKITTPSAPTKKTPDAKIKTTNTTSSNASTLTLTSTSSPKTVATKTATTTTAALASIASPLSVVASTTTTCGEFRKEDVCKNRERYHSADATTPVSKSDSTGGGNLSKFATVSNLAQCLQDVDADLDDFIPSSAEISEDENYTDDSDFDYSSIDGWEKFTSSMKKKIKQRRRKEKQAEQARFDPQKKVKIDTARKLFVKEEAPRYPLVATPRPLWKREKIPYPDEDSDESESEESGSTEETEESDECTTSEEFEDDLNPTASGGGATTSVGSGNSGSDPNIIRMSTCSNDSGFEGGTAPASPKKMLECDVNCHKKCERLTANLCGVNQKLIVEALASVKRGVRETRESPSTPPSLNPAYKIEPSEEQDETSYTYSQFQKSGRFTPPATIIPRFKNYSVDDFHFLAVLGKGSFGKVLLAELRDTTYYYAVKCLKKDVVLEDDDVDSTLIERKVLALGTKHPYLCHLFCTFQTESHLFFVMEYLNGGDLMFHIQESGRFTEERARFYGAEIISGLKFLHKKGIIYRDLKLDNVLLDYEGHVRIADFGMCKLQIYLDKTADSFCGTPDYMAPEIIKGESYNQSVDWWSFGVLLYEMLIGQSPFSGCDEDELFWSICNEIPWFPVYISAEATSILKGLLEKDYNKRVGSQYSLAGDIGEHIFFRSIDWNLLEKRQIQPPYRPQVKHPLDTQYFDRVFTRERVRLTPIDKDILQSMDQKQFLGFTYTNPHITLDD